MWYMEKYLFAPGSNWPRYEFEQRSYSRWAAGEILDRFFNFSSEPDMTPEIIIKDFIADMDLYCDIAEGTKREFIFSTAKETAAEILLLFERR